MVYRVQVQAVELNHANPEYGVLFLHGLGASGYDFVPWVESYFASDAISWRLPHAPKQAVTWLQGQEVPAWFDLFETSTRSQEDLPGLNKAADMVYQQLKILNSQGIPYNKIFIMGFSQGAALALFSGLQCSEQLAGIAAFSGYLPNRNNLQFCNQQHVWLSHGDNDQVLPLNFFELSESMLSQQQELTVTANVYQNMAHEVNHACSIDFYQWFNTRGKDV